MAEAIEIGQPLRMRYYVYVLVAYVAGVATGWFIGGGYVVGPPPPAAGGRGVN